jgi:hypothetical protein
MDQLEEGDTDGGLACGRARFGRRGGESATIEGKKKGSGAEEKKGWVRRVG